MASKRLSRNVKGIEFYIEANWSWHRFDIGAGLLWFFGGEWKGEEEIDIGVGLGFLQISVGAQVVWWEK